VRHQAIIANGKAVKAYYFLCCQQGDLALISCSAPARTIDPYADRQIFSNQ